MALSRRLKSLNARLAPGHLLYGPEWLVLGVNNACNLHCKMCDVGTGFSESGFYQNPPDHRHRRIAAPTAVHPRSPDFHRRDQSLHPIRCH
mgnify:CR=1 FL=1